MDYLYGPNVITRVFINERSRQEGQSQRRGWDAPHLKGSHDVTAGLKDGVRGHEPRNVYNI